jgi:poly-gamma-glutamate capsule biosynthesis protein CapA/YwtB (metallophosphatase superfamily)
MSKMEQLEIAAHQSQLSADVRQLIEKYVAIAEWDVPGVNEPVVEQLVVSAIRQALDHAERDMTLQTPLP